MSKRHPEQGTEQPPPKKRKHDDLIGPNIVETETLKGQDLDELREYLEKDVDPIELPEKTGDDDYPWVALDGASGTGKPNRLLLY